jgi:hypothetical protein
MFCAQLNIPYVGYLRIMVRHEHSRSIATNGIEVKPVCILSCAGDFLQKTLSIGFEPTSYLQVMNLKYSDND